jgi:hypothetical protein
MRVAIAFASLALSAFADKVPQAAKAIVDAKCAVCHRGTSAPAGLDLTQLAFDLSEIHTVNRWVRAHDAVRDGAMPPGGGLPPREREAFLKGVGQPILEAERARNATAGRSILRRLNRYEYENTVRDLLHAPWLELRDSLPEDGLLQRFNKSGQALDVSHVQMARYIETSEHALREVLRTAEQPQTLRRYYARDQRRMTSRMIYTSFNRHPERATIPILGFEAQSDVLSQKAPLTVGPANPEIRELEGFATPASTYIGNEYHFDQFVAPSGGRYRLRFHSFSIWIHTLETHGARGDKLTWWRPNREKTSRGRTTEPVTIYALSAGGEKRLLGSFDVGPEPAVHELEVNLLPGESIRPDAARLFRSRPGFVGSPDATAEGMPGVAFRWMEAEGPVMDPQFLQAVRAYFPERVDRLEAVMASFLANAYRRPPTNAETRRYMEIVQERASSGKAAVREALIAGYTAVLCSPAFLYLEEEPGPLNPQALASRLSYFLWNTAPDAELRRLAAKGSLVRRDVLRAQANRLLDSPRMRDFTNAFLDYWLDLRKVGDTTPDQTLYPDYYLDDLLVESAVAETRLFFADVLRRNLPAASLIGANFTMLNSHLAKHYGLPSVEGVEMRRVELPADSVRGGLLTQASVLKITANGTTTSPVLRGVWIQERIMGDPPPPPPPGTPSVEPDTRGATTIRQQLDKHRAIASCAVCHVKIDPPGFALESFDVLGGWRDRYRSTEEGEPVAGIGKNGHKFAFRMGQPVDASGRLPSGEEFSGIAEYKKLLLQNERQIARNMVHQLVTYATGAPVGFADRAEVERILDASAKDNYGLRTLVHEIVQSELFRNK